MPGRSFIAALMAVSALTLAWAQAPDRAALQAAVDGFHADDMNGRRITTAGLRGRVVLIEFWATWCPPCLADIPWLKKAREAHAEGLAIVGVSLDVVDRAAFTSWLRRHDVDWPQVYDGRGWSSPAVVPFGFDGIPFNVLVDPQGRVVGTNVRGEALLRTLRVLLPASPGDADVPGLRD